MVIYKANITDYPTILSLAVNFPKEDGHPLKPTSGNAIQSILLDSNLGEIYLIKLDNSNIGYFALCFTSSIEFGGKVVILDDLYLQNEFRNKGYGKSILKFVKHRSTVLNAVQIFLEVELSNSRAISFYEKAGFKIRKRHMMELLLSY